MKNDIFAGCCFRSRCSDKFHYCRIQNAFFPTAISVHWLNRFDCFVEILACKNKNWSIFFKRDRKAEIYQSRPRKFVIVSCKMSITRKVCSSISQKFYPHRFLSFKTSLPKLSFLRRKWSFLRLKVHKFLSQSAAKNKNGSYYTYFGENEIKEIFLWRL